MQKLYINNLPILVLISRNYTYRQTKSFPKFWPFLDKYMSTTGYVALYIYPFILYNDSSQPFTLILIYSFKWLSNNIQF